MFIGIGLYDILQFDSEEWMKVCEIWRGTMIKDFEKHVNKFTVYGPMLKSKVSDGMESRKLFDGSEIIYPIFYLFSQYIKYECNFKFLWREHSYY